MESRAIVVTSGKGGVGKTTATANLGTVLAQFGHRVVVVDADIGLRNLDVVMGLENRIVYNLVDVVRKKCRIQQALIRDKRNEGLFLMPASQTDDKSAVNPDEMRRLSEDLKKEFDFIIFDSPAGIEQGFRNAVAGAQEAIVVTTPEVSAIRDADRVIGLLQAEGIAPQLIINRMSYAMVKRGDMLDQTDIIDILAIDLLGIIPEDEGVVISSNRGTPIVFDEQFQAGKAFRRIGKRIIGEEVPFFEPEENGSFLARIGKKIAETFRKKGM